MANKLITYDENRQRLMDATYTPDVIQAVDAIIPKVNEALENSVEVDKLNGNRSAIIDPISFCAALRYPPIAYRLCQLLREAGYVTSVIKNATASGEVYIHKIIITLPVVPEVLGS